MDPAIAWRSVLTTLRSQLANIPQRLRTQISVFLISTGISLIVLTLGTYHWMHMQQQRLLQEVQAMPAVSAAAQQGQEQGVVLLSIPKINLKAAIVEGTGRKTLLFAPGHLENTAQPGEPGNSVIAAHRDTFFRRIHELEHGDDILVTRQGHQYHYVVTGKSIVDPNAVSAIRPSDDVRLTLVTCYPTYYIGPAPKRLVIVATLQSRDDIPNTLSAATPSFSR